MIIMTWIVHGDAGVQLTPSGNLTCKVCCPVKAVADLRRPSASTGCVADQTGFIKIGGLHALLVAPVISGSVVVVCDALLPV
jgi:hypothetical protein